MGQRLVMNITYKGKTLANAYYHWSGYTSNAYNICTKVYHSICAMRDSGMTDNYLLAIKALEVTGAGFPDYENDKLLLSNLYPDESFYSEVDRNAGILAAFPKTCADNFSAGEEFAYLDIADMIFNFRVCCYYDDFNELKKYFEDDALDDIPEYDFSPAHMDYGTLRDFVSGISSHTVIKCVDGYFSAIE